MVTKGQLPLSYTDCGMSKLSCIIAIAASGFTTRFSRTYFKMDGFLPSTQKETVWPQLVGISLRRGMENLSGCPGLVTLLSPLGSVPTSSHFFPVIIKFPTVHRSARI